MKYCVLQQIWETKKVCKSSDAVLKSELDVVFHNGEVMILAIYNQKHLQVSCVSQCACTFECYLHISVGNGGRTERTACSWLSAVESVAEDCMYDNIFMPRNSA